MIITILKLPVCYLPDTMWQLCFPRWPEQNLLPISTTTLSPVLCGPRSSSLYQLWTCPVYRAACLCLDFVFISSEQIFAQPCLGRPQTPGNPKICFVSFCSSKPRPGCPLHSLKSHQAESPFYMCIIFQLKFNFRNDSSSPLCEGDTSQDPQWMSETLDRTQPYRYCFSLQILMMESYIVLNICTE